LRGGRSRIVSVTLQSATIQYVENTQKDWLRGLRFPTVALGGTKT
jgi:hypothetical protein